MVTFLKRLLLSYWDIILGYCCCSVCATWLVFRLRAGIFLTDWFLCIGLEAVKGVVGLIMTCCFLVFLVVELAENNREVTYTDCFLSGVLLLVLVLVVAIVVPPSTSAYYISRSMTYLKITCLIRSCKPGSSSFLSSSLRRRP